MTGNQTVAYAAVAETRDIPTLYDEAIALGRTHCYRQQGDVLMHILAGVDPYATTHLELRLDAVQQLASLMREVAELDALSVIEPYLTRVWPYNFCAQRFHALRALGWWHALQGDTTRAFRRLRESLAVAGTPERKVLAITDRAYFALCLREKYWFQDTLEEAEQYLRYVDWSRATGEESLSLLALAELLVKQDLDKAVHYLARFQECAKVNSFSPLFAVDYTHARIAYSVGSIEIARGHYNAGLTLLRASRETFLASGFQWRAARCLMQMYRVSPQRELLIRADEHLQAYPKSWLPRELSQLRFDLLAGRKLPPMQQRILNLLCKGLGTRDIAKSLDRSPFTVRNHIKEIFKTFGVTSRCALLIEAAHRSLL